MLRVYIYDIYQTNIYIYEIFIYIFNIYVLFFLVYIRNIYIYILSLALRFRIVVSVVSFECVFWGAGGGASGVSAEGRSGGGA